MKWISIVAASAAFATAGLACGAANAAAIAPKARVTAAGKSMNYNWKGPCPKESVVGAPAYPGSTCIKAAHYNSKSAFVDLLSNAKADTVAGWYAKHLNGWTRRKSTEGDTIFTPPSANANEATYDPTADGIAIKAVSPTNAKLKKMFYILKGTPKTAITINYALK